MYNNGHVVAGSKFVLTYNFHIYSNGAQGIHKNDIIIRKYGTVSIAMSVSFTEGTL